MATLLKSLVAAFSLLSLAFADQNQTYLGFNSGAYKPDNSAKTQSDFEAEFKAARALVGAPGNFNSIRLYTNIQFGTTNSPSEAFPAAISTGTSMLLGLWASGTDNIDNELAALKSAIDKYGTSFADLVIAISVGSEDLYRQSAPGLQNKAGVGNTPANIKKFIQQVRNAIADTPLASKPVGHVDTYDQFANDSNSDALDAADFWGVNAFPYYETNKVNVFSNATNLFSGDLQTAHKAAAVKNKPVWVTEAGWPWTGPVSGKAVASVDNAKAYWDNVGCDMLFGKINTWWYALVDGNPANKEQFDITENLSTTARFNLTCPAKSEISNSTANSTSGSSTGGSGTSGTSGGSSASSTARSGAASIFDTSLAAPIASFIVGLIAVMVY